MSEGCIRPRLALWELPLDDSELFLEFAELGAVLRLIIPTPHHNFKDLLWTILRC